ncbi:MAG: hypothetical protein CFE21_11440 [Bacteroidetes bacterium B1(2017)]|nr:MAG: hypothetical protein CFE21_11440 [Bacteroidetes bacterium B1(2017)]
MKENSKAIRTTVKILLGVSLLLVFGSNQALAQDSTKTRVVFEPLSNKLIPIFTADSRAHRLSFQKNFDQTSYTASMGGVFPFMNISKKKLFIQLSAAGSTYLTLARQNHAGSVQNIDFFGDLFCDIKISHLVNLRLGTGHTSQHLSDDALIAGNPFKNYAKDYHQLMLVYTPSKKFEKIEPTPNYLFFYGGISYAYNFKTYTDISNKILVQTGFEHMPLTFKNRMGLYYGADIKWRQENNYAYTLNTQIGIKSFNNWGKSMRLAIDYTLGTDERGYYQPTKRNFAHLGVYFDL